MSTLLAGAVATLSRKGRGKGENDKSLIAAKPECAIQMTVVTLKKWTVNELLAMDRAGLLDPSKRIELVNGEVYELGIGEGHAGTIIRLGKLLERFFGNRALVSSQNPLRMGDLGLPRPDVALLKPRDDFYTTAHPTPADAFLEIEVADSSIKYDREIKLPSYAENGVREVWIVNLNAGHTEVYRDPQDGEYLTRFTAQKGAAVAPAAFSDDAIIPELQGFRPSCRSFIARACQASEKPD